MKAQNVGFALIKLFVAGMLLWALARHPYSYYMMLRWITCATGAFVAIRTAEHQKSGWFWIFVVVAVVFNPIVPVYLKRDTWAFVDVAAAAIFLFSIIVDIRPTSAKK